MNRFLSTFAVVLIGTLGISRPADSGAVNTSVTGSLSNSENACAAVWALIEQTDCSYDGTVNTITGDFFGPLRSWYGPGFGAGFYNPGTAPRRIFGGFIDNRIPANDGKINPSLTGTVTVDDNGTAGFCEDDQISFDLDIGPADREATFGGGGQNGSGYFGEPGNTAVESWTNINHTMVPTPVSSGTPNLVTGGCDYVIGSEGMPVLLTDTTVTVPLQADPIFPSEAVFPTARSDFYLEPTPWTPLQPTSPKSPEIVSMPLLTGGPPNIGGSTTATVTPDPLLLCEDWLDDLGGDYSGCDDISLVTSGVVPGQADWDNVLLELSTDSGGQVVSVFGFYVVQWLLVGPPPSLPIFPLQNGGNDDSWYAGTLNLEQQTNNAPIADAGPDQPLTVLNQVETLDGSGSFDDDDGDYITYAWTEIAKPVGSTASLDDATAEMPHITPDLQGDYIFELVVTDSFGAVSDPDDVVLSFANVPPVADTGGNQNVSVGAMVILDGTGSSDGNGDPLTYNWTFFAPLPAGSTAVIGNASSDIANFVADVGGDYFVSLTVDDGNGGSATDTATIHATSAVSEVIGLCGDFVVAVNAIDSSDLRNRKLAKPLTNKCLAVIKQVENGEFQKARDKLANDIATKMDGCAIDGAPHKTDWIKNCAAQGDVYSLIAQAIALLDSLL